MGWGWCLLGSMPRLLLLAVAAALLMQAGQGGGESTASESSHHASSMIHAPCSFIQRGRHGNDCPSPFRVMVLAVEDGSKETNRMRELLNAYNGSDLSMFSMPVIHHKDAGRLQQEGIGPSDVVAETWMEEDFFDTLLTRSVLYQRALADSEKHGNLFFLFMDLELAEVLLLREFPSMMEEVMSSVSSFVDVIKLDMLESWSSRNWVEKSDVHAMLHGRDACAKILAGMGTRLLLHPSLLLRDLVKRKRVTMFSARRGAFDVTRGREEIALVAYESTRKEGAEVTFLLETSVSSAYIVNVSFLSPHDKLFFLSRQLWDCEREGANEVKEGEERVEENSTCSAMTQSGMLILFPISRNRHLLGPYHHVVCSNTACQELRACSDRFNMFQVQEFGRDHACWGKTSCNLSVSVTPSTVNGHLQSRPISLLVEELGRRRFVSVCFLIHDERRVRLKPSMKFDSAILFLSQLESYEAVAKGGMLRQRLELAREMWKLSMTRGVVFELVVFCTAKSVEDGSCERFSQVCLMGEDRGARGVCDVESYDLVASSILIFPWSKMSKLLNFLEEGRRVSLSSSCPLPAADVLPSRRRLVAQVSSQRQL